MYEKRIFPRERRSWIDSGRNVWCVLVYVLKGAGSLSDLVAGGFVTSLSVMLGIPYIRSVGSGGLGVGL